MGFYRWGLRDGWGPGRGSQTPQTPRSASEHGLRAAPSRANGGSLSKGRDRWVPYDVGARGRGRRWRPRAGRGGPPAWRRPQGDGWDGGEKETVVWEGGGKIREWDLFAPVISLAVCVLGVRRRMLGLPGQCDMPTVKKKPGGPGVLPEPYSARRQDFRMQAHPPHRPVWSMHLVSACDVQPMVPTMQVGV